MPKFANFYEVKMRTRLELGFYYRAFFQGFTVSENQYSDVLYCPSDFSKNFNWTKNKRSRRPDLNLATLALEIKILTIAPFDHIRLSCLKYKTSEKGIYKELQGEKMT